MPEKNDEEDELKSKIREYAKKWPELRPKEINAEKARAEKEEA